MKKEIAILIRAKAEVEMPGEKDPMPAIRGCVNELLAGESIRIGHYRVAFSVQRVEDAIDMLLFCPNCNFQHVDAPQPEKDWTNPPHRSHECQSCGWVWRPADVPTNGVKAIETRGQRDLAPEPHKFVDLRAERYA